MSLPDLGGMEKLYAIIRVKPIRNRTVLGHVNSHGKRTDISAHVDRCRSHLNEFYVPPLGLEDPSDLIAAVDRVTEVLGAHRRSDSAGIAADFHVGASPEFFLYDDGRDGIDFEKLYRWVAHNIEAFERRFPNQVAQVRLDLDEQTPHLAIFVVPTYVKTTKSGAALWVSYQKAFGGKRDEASAKCIALQDWYAEEMRCFGLHRGEPRRITQAAHLHHSTYRRQEAQKSAETQRQLELAESKNEESSKRLDEINATKAALDAERAAFDAERAAFSAAMTAEWGALNAEKNRQEQQSLAQKVKHEEVNRKSAYVESRFHSLKILTEMLVSRQISRKPQEDGTFLYRAAGASESVAALEAHWPSIEPLANTVLNLFEQMEAALANTSKERADLTTKRKKHDAETSEQKESIGRAITTINELALAYSQAIAVMTELVGELSFEQRAKLESVAAKAETFRKGHQEVSLHFDPWAR